tara:strand:- start:133 stop:879 length:747 start_codon:yes stop_codon:yes gene_type:complete
MNLSKNNDQFMAFAHRGGTEFAPENTYEAFSSAVSIGYKYLETDVHPNADNKLMAFHDSSVDRVTNYKGKICNFTSSELKKIKVKEKFQIPFLEDLIESFSKSFFSIDMKSDQSVKPLIKLIKSMNAVDRVCFASFSQDRIDYVRDEFDNKCITSMGPREIIKTKISSIINFKHKIIPKISSLPISRYRIKLLNKRHINFLKSLNIKVIAWTINDVEAINKLIDLGVDGIMTDNISVLKKILIKKNIW